MKTIKITLLAVLLTCSFTSFANSEAEVEAAKLMKVMDMDKVMNDSMSNMVDIQIQQQPTLAPFKSVMMKFFQKHMSWESLEFEFIYIYSQAFTAQELKELTAFYETPTGKKTIEKMPQLMAQGAQIGAARVQENMPELQAMIKEEAERLKQLSEQQN
ncbi:DUF2059 domain-containing protein [Pseudoalteromonas phenolica]|uniref:DUF2059 domain-containing protein n=1 Tax=Pseudoalteromonas phenolica TaxID=161398 RepID=UPI00110B0BC9|nr:DUF2059 domain-containing protein [Pseudoalteromonas phenolica]TMO56399.1 hypothetical protein CWC21_06785 [Pseudoalteromonas phenolica]